MESICDFDPREYIFGDMLSSSKSVKIDRVNVGTGNDTTILELAQLVSKVIGYHGEIWNDLTMLDGTHKVTAGRPKDKSPGVEPESQLI